MNDRYRELAATLAIDGIRRQFHSPGQMRSGPADSRTTGFQPVPPEIENHGPEARGTWVQRS
jgi:hypothetical protein